MEDLLVPNDAISLGKFDTIEDENITFSIGGEEVLRLTEKGMVYKGELIEDAGEAHRMFLEVLRGMKAARGE